jgi:hypothetical protein
MQKNLFQNILLLLLLTVAHFVQAQTEAPKDSKITIIDFRKGGKDAQKEDKTVSKKAISNYSGYHNAIWIDAVSTLGGFPSVSYQRVVTPGFAVEVGGGMTISGLSDPHSTIIRLFAPQIAKENKLYWEKSGYTDNDKDDFMINQYDINQTLSGTTDKKAATPLLGHHFFVDAKYYLQNEEPFQSLYLAARINYMRFNYQALVPLRGRTNTSNLVLSSEKTDIYKTYLDFIPCLGFEQGGGPFVLNYELGIGARSTTAEGYDSAYKTTNNGTFQDYRLQTNTSVIPVVLFAMKVGFAF